MKIEVCIFLQDDMQKTRSFLSTFNVKYIDNAAMQQVTHIYREKIKMFTLKLFDGWLRGLAPRPSDKDLATWARIEYKKDSVYAYNYMLEHGVAPSTGVSL